MSLHTVSFVLSSVGLALAVDLQCYRQTRMAPRSSPVHRHLGMGSSDCVQPQGLGPLCWRVMEAGLRQEHPPQSVWWLLQPCTRVLLVASYGGPGEGEARRVVLTRTEDLDQHWGPRLPGAQAVRPQALGQFLETSQESLSLGALTGAGRLLPPSAGEELQTQA